MKKEKATLDSLFFRDEEIKRLYEAGDRLRSSQTKHGTTHERLMTEMAQDVFTEMERLKKLKPG